MKHRTIEIDQDVFDLLKSKAEPFADTPNTVLRRLLLGRASPENLGPATASLPSLSKLEFPTGTPATLQEILSVVYLMDAGQSRQQATQITASRYGITAQSVIDKYTRQLRLTAAEFDGYVNENGRDRLFELLRKRVRGYDGLIRKHLGI